jgi:flagellar hook-associated protein 3 FlgL
MSTRVTQSMLSTNMLRNLNSSYSKMSKLQDQINTGRVITRASDDPVVAVKGMDYRVQLDKIGQYSRNLNEVYSWVDTTDTTLSQVTESLTRVQELVTQAANDTNTPDERAKMEVEIKQIREQIQDLANTQVGGKYIFSGTNTHTPLFTSGVIADSTEKKGLMSAVQVEVSEGVIIPVNIAGYDLFKSIDDMLAKVVDADNGIANANTTGDTIGGFLTDIQNGVGAVLDVQAEVGAKQNRVDTVANRLSDLELNVTKQMSLNEDTDYSKAITEMTTQESIHQAALSVGAKIIQTTLVDFIR